MVFLGHACDPTVSYNSLGQGERGVDFRLFLLATEDMGITRDQLESIGWINPRDTRAIRCGDLSDIQNGIDIFIGDELLTHMLVVRECAE